MTDINLVLNSIVKYPPGQSDAVVIKPIDMICLEKFELLNDNVISFYLKYNFFT